MHSARFGLLLCILLLSVPVWARQAPQSAPQSDPQALAVVQAAITALGGATALAQAQSWTFQAQMQGSRANGSVEYVMSTDTDTGKFVRPDGTTRPAHAIHSLFVPALVGSILLKETKDPEFSLHYVGLSTVDSKPVTIIVFTIEPDGFPAQIWSFDASNLPVWVDFRSPAEIGARQSLYGEVALSDYRPVSGVLYPFRMISIVSGKPPEIVTLQLVAPAAGAPPNMFNGPAGDLR
jgi:hypothetical protein